MSFDSQQQEICQKYNVVAFPTSKLLKVGISRNVLEGAWPINGLRHPPEGDTSGWYLWAGEEPSTSNDFFMPMHEPNAENGAKLSREARP